MTTKIQKWGNSLAVRIPKSYAKEINLKEGIQIDLRLDENKIIISPKKKKRKNKYTLEELVSKITPENRYGEIDFGPPVGKEIIE
ncbi:MAG TPA: AbrB/MazE/SpoVT family DNA-binding domain-containing protein [Ignavibacteria bacterium]|nr:AbrB/MazE/SpoVT family DNA-binding domain-containing protein [Ignavibacteria bacterium]